MVALAHLGRCWHSSLFFYWVSDSDGSFFDDLSAQAAPVNQPCQDAFLCQTL
jgi:hypothetical protein